MDHMALKNSAPVSECDAMHHCTHSFHSEFGDLEVSLMECGENRAAIQFRLLRRGQK